MSNKGKPYGIRPPAWWAPGLVVVKRGGRPGFRGLGRRLGLELWGWLGTDVDYIWRDQFRESMTDARPKCRIRETFFNLNCRFSWTKSVPDRKRAAFVRGVMDTALPSMPEVVVAPEPEPTEEERELAAVADLVRRRRQRQWHLDHPWAWKTS